MIIKEIPIKSSRGWNILEVELYYDLGGMNYFTMKTVRRGFYLSVRPVEKANGWKRSTAFSGITELILEVKRYSEEKRRQAEALCTKEKIQKLINYVANKNNLIIKEEEK